MTAQFDALTQLFDQITERLIRIETKLDGKADLNVVGALEGRIRDLEIDGAKKDAALQELAPKVIRIDETVRGLESKDKEVRAARQAVEGFRLDSWKKKTAAAGAAAVVLFSFLESAYRAATGT